jgi:hypothetical protein
VVALRVYVVGEIHDLPGGTFELPRAHGRGKPGDDAERGPRHKRRNNGGTEDAQFRLIEESVAEGEPGDEQRHRETRPGDRPRPGEPGPGQGRPRPAERPAGADPGGHYDAKRLAGDVGDDDA